MIETLAILLACWIGWRHLRDSAERLRSPQLVPLGASRYRRALRRLAQSRYKRSCVTRQQVRVLANLAWRMNGKIGQPPGPVHIMKSVSILPQLYLGPKQPHPCTYMRKGEYGLASIIGQTERP